MDKAHAGGAVEIYCGVWNVSILRTALTVLRNTSLLPSSSGSTNFDPSSHLVWIFGFSGAGVLSSSVLFLLSAIPDPPPPSRLPEAYHLSSRTAAREPSVCGEHVAQPTDSDRGRDDLGGCPVEHRSSRGANARTGERRFRCGATSVSGLVRELFSAPSFLAKVRYLSPRFRKPHT